MADNNENINVIEIIQTIVSNMKEIETKYFEAQKLMTTLNERQNDLVHALELDITEKEVLAVGKALQELRKERRELKDSLTNLEEAKNFVASNYKFMNEALELSKKMERTAEWTSTRKYFVRDCESLKKVLDISKHERISLNRSLMDGSTETKTSEPVSQVEKFNKRAKKAQAQ